MNIITAFGAVLTAAISFAAMAQAAIPAASGKQYPPWMPLSGCSQAGDNHVGREWMVSGAVQRHHRWHLDGGRSTAGGDGCALRQCSKCSVLQSADSNKRGSNSRGRSLP